MFENSLKNNNDDSERLSTNILKYLTKYITTMTYIFNEMSTHHMTLCLEDTKLLNIQIKTQNIPRTQDGYLKFNDLYDETKYIFSNILKIRKDVNMLMTKQNASVNTVQQMRNMFILITYNENTNINQKYDDNDEENQNANIQRDYLIAEDIIFNQQNNANILYNDVDTFMIDLKTREMNTLSNLIIEMNNRITPLLNNCLNIRNDVAQRLRERMNIDRVPINI